MAKNNMKMQGKRVLVTGSGTGIGSGVALEFAKEGADVVLHYAHSSTGAESVKKEIFSLGRKAEAFQADLCNLDEINELAEQAISFLGGIDVLVNNAGVTTNIPFDKVKPEQFDTLFNINIRAQFFLTQAVLPAMERNGKGIVINLASTHAFAGQPEHTIYASTKGAIVAFTRTVSLELIQKGIRVNAIAPGWTRTENQEVTFGQDFDWKAGAQMLPAGFIAMPGDIGHLAIFLASEESRFIIGQTIIADGGQLAVMACAGDFREPKDKYQFGKNYVPNYGR